MSLKMPQVAFLLLLVAVSLLYGLMLKPLLTSILWAGLIAVLFHPLKLRLQPRFGRRHNLLALVVLLVCIVMVILPVSVLLDMLLRQAALFYARIQSGEIDLLGLVGRKLEIPPAWEAFLARFDISLEGLQNQLLAMVKESGSLIASHAFSIGQNTAQFLLVFILMMYLAFFFIRDGEMLVRQLMRALPLGNGREQRLVARVSEVVNAVVRGGLTVATVQGTLGGLMFWVLGVKMPLLWGVTMVFASLIPAVGASLIWAPVAVYLILSGFFWKGVILGLFGAFVIGLIDNLLRPILVGRGTGVPDYLVLVSTLGGILMFGVNGFLLGPLIIAVFISLWEMFIREYHPG